MGSRTRNRHYRPNPKQKSSGNEISKRKRRTRSRSDTSWERAADWYDGWVGSRGSAYHRRIAVPTVLDLLGLRPGERVLDVGAGQGVLAPRVVSAGAHYVGVDASPRMVELARKRHGRAGRFLVGDARSLRDVELGGRFDAAVFLLSLQDMEPLDAVIGQAAKSLGDRGRLVVFMVHPCFRVPRQSGWGFDEERKLPVRRVDRYLMPLAVPMGRTTSFHRPLEKYIAALARHSLLVDRLVEIPDDEAWAKKQGRTNNADIPLFLALRAVKAASG